MSPRPLVFGTDGVRDRAGEGYLAPDSVRRLVVATAAVLRQRERFPEDFPPGRGEMVCIARDTRASGLELVEQVAGGLRAAGFPVGDLGVLPTGGAALIASTTPDCVLGAVISASHNPAEYNGIKFVSATGAKVSPGFEEAVSERYHDTRAGDPGVESAPRIDLGAKALEAYVAFLTGSSWRPERLRGKRVVLDMANGAAFRAAPEVFGRLGMEVESIGASPDGSNINRECGALHPEALAEKVRATGARLGFSFDGDADRVIPVTGTGRVLDGDHMLALAGRSFHDAGKLPKRAVVGTVMSNIGLEKCLAGWGLELRRTPVGDRHVYRCLVEEGHPFGGEQSGHVIFIDDLRTGDGILAAIRLLDVLQSDDLDLERESAVMTRYPQILRNVEVAEKKALDEIPAVARAVREVEDRLGAEGRVLLRYSGTEPLARVMLEGPDEELIGELCERISNAIRKTLGA